MSQRAYVSVVNAEGAVTGRLSRKEAKRYVKRGRARWVDDSLTFIHDAGDYRELSVQRSVSQVGWGYQQASRIGIATLDAIRHVPVVGRPDLLLTERRRPVAA